MQINKKALPHSEKLRFCGDLKSFLRHFAFEVLAGGGSLEKDGDSKEQSLWPDLSGDFGAFGLHSMNYFLSTFNIFRFFKHFLYFCII